MKKFLSLVFLMCFVFAAIGQSTVPRFGTTANADNTGRVLTWGYKAKAYQAVDTIKTRVYDYTYKVGTLTGALTLKSVVTGNHVGDRLSILFTDDGNGRTITFSTGFTSGGTLTMTASSKAVVYFVFNGVGWFQLSGQDLVTGLAGDGSAAAAGIGFTGQPDMGLYKVSATELGFTAGGVKAAGLSTTGFNVVNVLGAGNGTVSLPAYSFISDPDCGLYRIGANNDGYALNGAKVLDIKTTGLGVTGNVIASAPIIRNHTIVAPMDSTETISAAYLARGYITCTSAAATTLTLPTASAVASAIGAVQGTIFDFWVDNVSGANTVTVAVNTGITASGFPGTNTLSIANSATIGVAGYRLTFFSATGATLTRIN
jgi:hypothetical protein